MIRKKITDYDNTDTLAAGDAILVEKADGSFKHLLGSDMPGGGGLDQDLQDIAALSPSNDDLLQRKAGSWTNRTPAQVKTDLALVKGDVGLGNVDNTTDANKPVSTATQTELDTKGPLNLTINAQTGTDYTLVLGDNSKLITLDNASPIDLNIPTNASVAFAVGSQIHLAQTAAGQVTVVPDVGVTLVSADDADKLRVEGSTATLIKIATNTWLLCGDIVA